MTVDATTRRNDFWRPFVHPDTVYKNDPADGHVHKFQPTSPKSLGTFGPVGIVCIKCGWFKSWGEAT